MLRPKSPNAAGGGDDLAASPSKTGKRSSEPLLSMHPVGGGGDRGSMVEDPEGKINKREMRCLTFS